MDGSRLMLLDPGSSPSTSKEYSEQEVISTFHIPTQQGIQQGFVADAWDRTDFVSPSLCPWPQAEIDREIHSGVRAG